jgi:hypothetical protein
MLAFNQEIKRDFDFGLVLASFNEIVGMVPGNAEERDCESSSKSLWYR